MPYFHNNVIYDASVTKLHNLPVAKITQHLHQKNWPGFCGVIVSVSYLSAHMCGPVKGQGSKWCTGRMFSFCVDFEKSGKRLIRYVLW